MLEQNYIKELIKLYLVTDSEILRDRDFYECIEEAIKGGVRIVQLREKNISRKDFLEKALKLRELTKKYNAKLIINDRVDIAMISRADGVHVGQSDIDAKAVRELIGEDKILGVSACSLREAKKAKEDGADYIGVGAMYSTTTKNDANLVSISDAKSIKEKIDIPIVLIGGITLDKIKDLNDINADGYAVVSAILESDDIYDETKKWKQKTSVHIN
ncbi:MAG: thiamine phosphate synthase [Peptostreptococcaceae bacterium]